MGGFFGAISHKNCIYDVFFGTDYHSHLGTRRAGLAFYDQEQGFQRQIHSIENTPFRTKFDDDMAKFSGNAGIGCISDTDPQPLLVRSHLGMFAISTVGIITNAEQLVKDAFSGPGHQFMAMSSGKINTTELTAALINQRGSLIDGIRYAQEVIDGSCTILLLTPDAIIAARDRLGRLPVLVGKNNDGMCVSFESFAYHKLGYQDHYELGPGEIVKMTADGLTQLAAPGTKMKICAFLWTYYGYPNSNYEGKNVEVMRYRNGEIMARREMENGTMPDVDFVAGVPDSGLPHAIGAGCFLVEIQEPTDYTIRVERTTPSGFAVADSMCHQGLGFEKMFECFHYEPHTREEIRERWFIRPENILTEEGGSITTLVGYKNTPLFRLDEVKVSDTLTVPCPAQFSGLYVLEGAGTLTAHGRSLPVQKGDQIFVPAGTGSFALQADAPLRVLHFFGPKKNA